MTLKPRFSPEINFGHLMQASVLVLTVVGGAVTSYFAGTLDDLAAWWE